MKAKKTFGYGLLTIITLLTYLFLYLPIIVLVVYSFNQAKFPDTWVGFSWRWYQELFASTEIWSALQNSLIVAFSSVYLSVSMATLFVFFGVRSRVNKTLFLFYGSLGIPDVVLAVGLLSLFMFFSVPLHLTTLIAGHTLIGLAYAVPMMQAQFDEIDPALIEASADLGATQLQTFFKVILPLLSPALLASGLLVFILSFDDFIISFFCAGGTAQTLSLYIFSTIRTEVTPVINALSTLMLLFTSVLVLGFFLLRTRTRVF